MIRRLLFSALGLASAFALAMPIAQIEDAASCCAGCNAPCRTDCTLPLVTTAVTDVAPIAYRAAAVKPAARAAWRFDRPTDLASIFSAPSAQGFSAGRSVRAAGVALFQAHRSLLL